MGYCLPGLRIKGSFSQPVNFLKAIFLGKADFSKVKFLKKADFTWATFKGYADFSGAEFSDDADFGRALFRKEADFSDVKFSGEASFNTSKFFRRGSFASSTFFRYADFNAARFLDEAAFHGGTKFLADAGFNVAKISGRAHFNATKFSNDVDFKGAKFSKVDFEYAEFAGEAGFKKTSFSAAAKFNKVKFLHETDFTAAKFYHGGYFSNSKFLKETYFSACLFNSITFFNYLIFEQQNKILFDKSNLSYVSFSGTDITRIRFGDNITWGGEDGFTIIEEEWLRNKVKGKKIPKYEDVSFELVLSVYRNLRENYEFRLRYDDAGKFFIKEMELKRRYRQVSPISGFKLKLITLGKKLKRDQNPVPELTHHLKENCRFRRHFSLTGLYYHLSKYGESISRPTLIAVITVTLSTLFWVTQSDPSLEPHFQFFSSANNPSAVVAADSNSTTSTFVGFDKAGEPSQWLKALERSFADFLPLLPAGDFKVGIIDYIIKIVGGALTFGLLIIAFRRKFERKYTR